MGGPGPFWCQLGLLQCFLVSVGFISVLAGSNPVLRLHSGCLRTCWIELSLERELDFTLLQEFQFGRLFGHLLDLCPLLFIAKHISGLHLVPLWAPAETSFASLAALWHPPGITSRPRVTFCSFLGSLGPRFGDPVAPICSPSTCVHCPLPGGQAVFLLAI